MRRQDIQSQRVKAKFIISKLRQLTMNSRHRVRYEDNLNNVLEDIFKVKLFTRKLGSAKRDVDVFYVMNLIGMDKLLDICNSGDTFELLKELLQMDYRIQDIKYRFRKLNKQGKKRPKDMVKEYNYLTDLYPDACKAIRKKYGIKEMDTSYKKRFRSVADIVKSKKRGYFDDDFDEMFFDDLDDWDFDNDPLFGDDYDDDDFERNSESEFDTFAKKYSKSNITKRSSQRQRNKTSNRSIAKDWADEADEEEDDWGFSEKSTDKADKRLERLEAMMCDVASTLQYMKNTNTNFNQQPVPAQPNYVYNGNPSPVVNDHPLPRKAATKDIDNYYFRDFAEKMSAENTELKQMMAQMINKVSTIENDLYSEDDETEFYSDPTPVVRNGMWNQPQVGAPMDPIYGDVDFDEDDPDFNAEFEKSVAAAAGNVGPVPGSGIAATDMINMINSNGYAEQ